MSRIRSLAEQPAHEAPTALRLLIAEDEPCQRLVLRERLSQAQYGVESVADGKAALDRLRADRFDILITDLHMPGLSGLEVCRTLRAEPLDQEIYVIVVTGQEDTAQLSAALDAGADDFVRKSAPGVELLARLALAARIVRLRNTLSAAQTRNQLLSIMDPMLPLYNRRHLTEVLRREIERSRRHGHELSIVLAGIDRFKAVNDLYGHSVGDEVLERFAELVRAQLRGNDLAARHGGEEFAFLLPETGAAGARVMAERLRRTLEQTPLPASVGPLSLTASFGIATLKPPAVPEESLKTVLALFATADAALREAKRGGRNRVVTAGETV